jgi:hypothetical protein
MRRVPDIAAAEIFRLRKDGVELTDDDVVWLASLAREVERPGGMTPEAAGLMDGLRLSDGTILRPLTIRASRWLDRAGKLFESISDLYVVAYAMANRGKLVMNQPARDVVSDVLAWVDALNCEPAEVESAVARMLDHDAPKHPDESGMSAEKVIALLVAATGIPAERWENDTWENVSMAHGGVVRHAVMLSMMGGDPDAAESKAALRDLALAIEQIRKRGAENGV